MLAAATARAWAASQRRALPRVGVGRPPPSQPACCSTSCCCCRPPVQAENRRQPEQPAPVERIVLPHPTGLVLLRRPAALPATTRCALRAPNARYVLSKYTFRSIGVCTVFFFFKKAVSKIIKSNSNQTECRVMNTESSFLCWSTVQVLS